MLKEFRALFSRFWPQICYNFSAGPLGKPKNSIKFLAQNLKKIAPRGFVIHSYKNAWKGIFITADLSSNN
ncbi:MAG: hypothetical protein A3D44_02245 [Candidatus Staskawiczbacteria bacterium RIFCSPHIGHO2_02_FULL_42_22]|uniref:Uncharacterized protein n=1 Tax=Candidatus Staskawiczbacteria bacterium RIFCSPHIGHO2_02_FULL_42_22 TaxID=1802207 RepID=A0A1G2I1V3_9BACT|nr:MAG: hypothetical protein A3D44_02245 [Candidatus Staskawiczbacteria bacterium RIFCSPHIGHO2_02_FULL_42_22]